VERPARVQSDRQRDEVVLERGSANAKALVRLVNDALPELTEDQAWRLVLGAFLMTSTIWSHATPPQSVLDV
jgi:hypothetical protein